MKMNKKSKKLLLNLYSIHSPSGYEEDIKIFIERWINRNNISCDVTRDDYGNMYITKGFSANYPCIVAHLDQVQDRHSADFRVIETDEIFFGYSSMNKRMEGLGADDKNGIWIALQCLKKYDYIKIAFFVEEETGTIGSSNADLHFFSDCRFILEPDRRGFGDLITSISSSICSDEFLAEIPFEDFGYKETSGMLTDVSTLCSDGVGLSCLNISCGYYNPHTDEEFTNKRDLENCLRLIEYIIENCTDVYPHKYTSRYYGGYSSYYWKNDYPYYSIGKKKKNKSKDKSKNKSKNTNVSDEILSIIEENPELYPEDIWDIIDDELKHQISYTEFINIAYEYWYEYYLNNEK